MKINNYYTYNNMFAYPKRTIHTNYINKNINFTAKKVLIQSYKPKELEVLFSEKEIQNRIKSLAQEINTYYGNEPVTIVSVMKGALPFTMDLSKRLNMPVTKKP